MHSNDVIGIVDNPPRVDTSAPMDVRVILFIYLMGISDGLRGMRTIPTARLSMQIYQIVTCN